MYKFAGAFRAPGSKYLALKPMQKSADYIDANKFKAIVSSADLLLQEQDNNLNSLLNGLISAQIKVDTEINSKTANSSIVYRNLYLGTDVLNVEEIKAYRTSLLNAIRTRARANFIQAAGNYSNTNPLYNTIELQAQRAYQEYIINDIAKHAQT